MNHFKSLKVGTSPLLFVGCTIVAFGVTSFYFKNSESPQIANVIGHILLFPVYLFEEIANRMGTTDYSGNAVVVFFVLLLSYSIVAFTINKIIGWRQTDNT